MTVEVLASGSDGNVTALHVGEEIFLLDCGKTAGWTLERLGWKLPRAILLTHEHGDHSRGVREFLKRGVHVYATAGTVHALNLPAQYNLHTVKADEPFKVRSTLVRAFEAIHDAAEPVNFIVEHDGQKILYATDTGQLPDFAEDFDVIIIEANHSRRELLLSGLVDSHIQRVLRNHLSVERALTFLQHNPARQVHLIHISKRHGSAENFQARAVRATGNSNIFAH